MKIKEEDVYRWLDSKQYQKEQGEQEYSMYFDIDMPKILNDFLIDFASEDKWISVEESLPKESDNVIIYNGNFISIGFYRKDFNIQGDSAIALPRKWEYLHERIDWEITHWMPLPKAPNTK